MIGRNKPGTGRVLPLHGPPSTTAFEGPPFDRPYPLLSAALVVVLAAAGGAAYAERAASAPSEAATIIAADGRRIVGLDLATLLGKGGSDRQLVELAYERVEHAYYKPVADKLLVTGEQKALTDFLKPRRSPARRFRATPPPATANRDLAILESTLTQRPEALRRASRRATPTPRSRWPACSAVSATPTRPTSRRARSAAWTSSSRAATSAASASTSSRTRTAASSWSPRSRATRRSRPA